MSQSRFIRLRGLPWSVTNKEILDFLGVNVVGGEEGIHLVTSRFDGKYTGEAFIELESEADEEEAFKRNKENLGHRYIEIFSASNEEAEFAMRKPGQSKVVKLRGLPYSVDEGIIEDFFEGLAIKSDREGIVIVMDRRGRASGEAYVQFETQEDTENALKLHREKIGHRYIEIFRSSIGEMKRASNGGRSGPYDRNGRGGNRGNNIGGGNFGGRGNNRNSRPRGGDWNNDFGNNRSGNGGFNSNMGGGGGGFNNGGGFNGGPNNGGFGGGGGGNGRFNNGNSGFGNNFNSFGNNRNNFNDNSNDNFGNNNFPSNRNNMGNGGGGGNFGNNMFGSNNGGGMNNFGPIGGGRNNGDGPYTVHLRGLPYYCYENDVRDFFAPLRPSNVKIIYNNKGLHSGTADAYFDTEEDAEEAMKKDREQMGSRYIELFFDGKSKSGGFRRL